VTLRVTDGQDDADPRTHASSDGRFIRQHVVIIVTVVATRKQCAESVSGLP
jgi:hypothetical protein